jgi:hypothetical protein
MTGSDDRIIDKEYEWAPFICDPQAPSDTIKPTFTSPPGSLPAWLRWENETKLVGIPPSTPQGPVRIEVSAQVRVVIWTH